MKCAKGHKGRKENERGSPSDGKETAPDKDLLRLKNQHHALSHSLYPGDLISRISQAINKKS